MNESLPFAEVWMDLEIQRNKNTIWYYLYVQSKKYTDECHAKQKQTRRSGEQSDGYQRGKEGGQIMGLE